MDAEDQLSPAAVLDRLLGAISRHDADAVAACFAEDLCNEHLFYPERSFRGRERVRENWAAIFTHVPNFRMQVLRAAVEQDAIWIELLGSGTLAGRGTAVEAHGVMILGVRDGQIAWSRVYTEPVHRARAKSSRWARPLALSHFK